MTTVRIRQDKDSGLLNIDATLGGNTERLSSQRSVPFEVEDGTRYITLVAVTGSTANIDFQLKFTNAERPSGKKSLKDTGYNGYRGRFRLHIPEVG